jgi:hypothetical protein
MLAYGFAWPSGGCVVAGPAATACKYTLYTMVGKNSSSVGEQREAIPLEWEYRSQIADPKKIGAEGPCEPQFTELRDGRILLLMRYTSTPLMKAYSSDEGRTWTEPVATPLWSVWANVVRLGDEILVASSGRPGIGLWVCADGVGDSWEYFNLAAVHNGLLPRPLLPGRNGTSAMGFHPTVANISKFSSPDVSPPQTTGYTGLTTVGCGPLFSSCVVVVTYDRLADGWAGPSAHAAWGSSDMVYSMRVHIAVSTEEEEEAAEEEATRIASNVPSHSHQQRVSASVSLKSDDARPLPPHPHRGSQVAFGPNASSHAHAAAAAVVHNGTAGVCHGWIVPPGRCDLNCPGEAFGVSVQGAAPEWENGIAGAPRCGSYCQDHGHKPDLCGCNVCGSFGHCSHLSCTADNKTLFECPMPPTTAKKAPAAPLVLRCPGGKFGKISKLAAFFGTPTGNCTTGYFNGSCVAPRAQAVVTKLCVGKANCTLPSEAQISAWRPGQPSPLASLFLPDPCPAVPEHRFLAVHAVCFG